jgi:hypothetical protein
MHWELAPAFTTADRDMATSAPMGLKDAPVAGKQSLELLCIHEYMLLHTSVEVYISVERPPANQRHPWLRVADCLAAGPIEHGLTKL